MKYVISDQVFGLPSRSCETLEEAVQILQEMWFEANPDEFKCCQVTLNYITAYFCLMQNGECCCKLLRNHPLY